MMRARLRSLVRDRRGVAALEFALIAPMLIFLYLGVSILSSALLVQRKADHVASSLGDLVGQEATITPAGLADVCAVSNVIMTPYAATSTVLQMRVSLIQEDASNNVTVGWSYNCQGTTALTKGATYSGPATAYLSTSQSVVMAEVTYVYTPPIVTNISWLPASYTFTDKFYLQPRESQNVVCSTC